MADDSALISMSAAELAAAVRARKVRAEDVARAHLERIQRRDGEINAFQRVRGEAALDEARALDRRADLASLPLAGVPVAIKDNVDVAGAPTRHGTQATPAGSAPRDDELVARLRQAGAIVIGKTRMPELAIWPFTESAAFGDTRNPWNPARTPGGSSGGGAAAVAAQMAPLALGSDGGGSIRVPAACCGIAGLKPGPGVIPLAGGQAEHWLGLSEFGPMARTVEDVALMYDVLRGASPGAIAAPGRLRIAVSTKAANIGAPVASDVRQAIERLAQLLAAEGHEVETADPPYGLVGAHYVPRWLAGIAQDADALDRAALEPRTQAIVRAGNWLRRRGWVHPAAQDDFGLRMAQWLSGHDVLLTPTLAAPAVPVGKWRGKGWVTTLLGVANWLCTAPWNLARWPAASAPAGLSSQGLPIGAQLVAPPGGEGALLSLMAQVERLQPWSMPPD